VSEMINTNLILLEGLPGSGKTTISKKLFDRIHVKDSRLVQEHTSPHPIAESGSTDIELWQVKTLQNWERLAAEIDAQHRLYVMEFALFQNTIGELLLKDCTRQQIVRFCHSIANTIRDTAPVLVLYTADDPEAFLRETSVLRDKRWKERISSVIDDTPYGKTRSLTGFGGFVAFFNEYVSIANAIYGELAIDSLTIDVTERDWPKVEALTYDFLQI
jgi:predicted ATPase